MRRQIDLALWNVPFIATIVAMLYGLTIGFASSVKAQPPARGPAFTCQVINNSGTNLTKFAATGECPQATPGQAMVITDVLAASTAISTATTDNYPNLKYGTGTDCGTGTTIVWSAYTLTFTTVIQQLLTPRRLPSNVDLCWMHAATGSKTFIVSGYLTPSS